MSLGPPVPLGSIVRARVDGWVEAQVQNAAEFPDPAVPTLDGAPEWVEGELGGWEVDVPESGIHYFKLVVAGYDVDPGSVTVVGDASPPSGPPTDRHRRVNEL